MAQLDIEWPQIHLIDGVRLGAAEAGIKHKDRADLLLVEIDEGSSVSGVFTRNAFSAAPVILGREHLARGGVRAFVINSGNANACTGEQGIRDALHCCLAVAEALDIDKQQVIPFSTGVIGEHLPLQKICQAIPKARDALLEDAWLAGAKAIMTTDTEPKGASLQFEHDGEFISVTGIAKGSGMICPNMATMLAFVATDAVVSQPVLDNVCKQAADRSFNRATVDGDTSTNDACMLVATGRAGHAMISQSGGELYDKLLNAVTEVMQALAVKVIKDGEGATKFVTVEVKDGGSSDECLQVAYTIAHSPLVKTALFASDANWGRIVMAIGRSGLHGLDASKVKVWLDDILIVEDGGRAATYTEEQGAAVVARSEFRIIVSLGRGHASETIWTSDLSHDYVSINADYRS